MLNANVISYFCIAPQPMGKAHSYELLDWMRLGVTITTDQACRVMDLIERFDKNAVSRFYYFVHPQDDVLWPNLIARQGMSDCIT